ncbi:MAG TPA: hypothetical protein VF100_12220 [Thermoanaerobaculia bacterium]
MFPRLCSLRGVVRALASAAVLLAVVACGSRHSVERPAGSAVLGGVAEVAGLGTGEVADLRRAGVREVFLAAGEVVFEGTEPAIAVAVRGGPAAGLRLPAVVSIGGRWEGVRGDPAEVGTRLAERLRELVRRTTGRGLTVVGVHLDLAVPPDAAAVEAYAEAVEAVREELPEDLYLAVSLDRVALRAPEAESVAAAADVLVPFLFGPRAAGRPGPRGPEAWSLEGIEEDLARLAALGRPYLVGVGTVGGVARMDGTDGGGELFTGTRLGALLAEPGLEARPAPLFAAADAQVYPFVVRRALRLGDWSLAAGDEVEVRRLAPHHLRALVERLAAAGSPLHLGQLYDRLPGSDEGLALSPAELAAAGDPAAAAPRLDLVAEPAGRGVLRVRLAHRGGAATEIAAFENNFVAVRLAGGSFGTVDPGGFARYELLAGGRRAADQATLRRADTLRLYTPFLEAGDEVTSGPIRHGGTATAVARFLMPDGAVVEVAGEGP